MKTIKDFLLNEETGFSRYAALKILFDKGLLTDKNMEKVNKDLPISKSSGYIGSKALDKFAATLK